MEQRYKCNIVRMKHDKSWSGRVGTYLETCMHTKNIIKSQSLAKTNLSRLQQNSNVVYHNNIISNECNNSHVGQSFQRIILSLSFRSHACASARQTAAIRCSAQRRRFFKHTHERFQIFLRYIITISVLMYITVKSASYKIFRRDIIINQVKTASVHSTDRQSSEYDSFIQSNILLLGIIFLHNTLKIKYIGTVRLKLV